MRIEAVFDPIAMPTTFQHAQLQQIVLQFLAAFISCNDDLVQ